MWWNVYKINLFEMTLTTVTAMVIFSIIWTAANAIGLAFFVLITSVIVFGCLNLFHYLQIRLIKKDVEDLVSKYSPMSTLVYIYMTRGRNDTSDINAIAWEKQIDIKWPFYFSQRGGDKSDWASACEIAKKTNFDKEIVVLLAKALEQNIQTSEGQPQSITEMGV